MSTFISGVANPMTEALYKPPPRKPHIRRPPKTPHSFITGANKPAKRMTKEEREKFIEKKREELASKLDTRKTFCDSRECCTQLGFSCTSEW